MSTSTSELTRRVDVSPAYDLRPEITGLQPDYGIGSCRIWFYLIGPKGAVQFQIGTDWYTASAVKHLQGFPDLKRPKPECWDLGYHAREPQYETQDSMECHVLPEGKCYYDGSSLNALAMREGFVNGGTEYLWEYLEAYYKCVFEGAEFPEPKVVPQKHPKLEKETTK